MASSGVNLYIVTWQGVHIRGSFTMVKGREPHIDLANDVFYTYTKPAS